MLIQDTVSTQTVLFYYVKLAFDGCGSERALLSLRCALIHAF